MGMQISGAFFLDHDGSVLLKYFIGVAHYLKISKNVSLKTSFNCLLPVCLIWASW
jgi:hypothetical protein